MLFNITQKKKSKFKVRSGKNSSLIAGCHFLQCIMVNIKKKS